MLIQSKKIQVIKMQLQNENNILNNMADHLKALEKKKSFVSKKRRVMGQNKQHEINDRYNEDLDEVKNQRPDGSCEYHNFRNARCWNLADEDHSDGRSYCKKCLQKVLLEERNIKRESW